MASLSRPDAFVIGEPVTVVAFDYDGNQRRGLVARCRREDSSEHVVAVSELVLAPRWSGNHFLAAYHKWLGLDPLDAHAHLGNFVFEHRPNAAIRYYEVGVRIGELSLSPNFNGLLPWGHMDNRPFLRCLHGYGLCLWRLSRFEEAERVFDRMLWLNPTDNQGVRFLIDDVRARTAWEDRREER